MIQYTSICKDVELDPMFVQQLLQIPEMGMGWHYVWLYLSGPYPSEEVFRLTVTVKNSSILVWPVSIGDVTEYEFLRFEEITKEKSNIKPE